LFPRIGVLNSASTVSFPLSALMDEMCLVEVITAVFHERRDWIVSMGRDDDCGAGGAYEGCGDKGGKAHYGLRCLVETEDAL
jgi:hypothetical protein